MSGLGLSLGMGLPQRGYVAGNVIPVPVMLPNVKGWTNESGYSLEFNWQNIGESQLTEFLLSDLADFSNIIASGYSESETQIFTYTERDLAEHTPYYFRVRNIDTQTEEYSDWVTIEVYTLWRAVGGVFVDNVESDSLRVNWDITEGYTGNVIIDVSTTNDFSNIVCTNSTPYILGADIPYPLTPETTYYLRVYINAPLYGETVEQKTTK